MKIEIPRSKPTCPRDAPLMLWRFVFVLPMSAIFCIPFSKLAAALLGVASLLVVPGLLYHAIKSSWSRKRYLMTPGAVIDDTGVTLYCDGGPTTYHWLFWREAFVSTFDGKPIIQHLHVNDMNTEGYDRYSSYLLSAVDYLEWSPDKVLQTIQSHPNFLKSLEESKVNA